MKLISALSKCSSFSTNFTLSLSKDTVKVKTSKSLNIKINFLSFSFPLYVITYYVIEVPKEKKNSHKRVILYYPQ